MSKKSKTGVYIRGTTTTTWTAHEKHRHVMPISRKVALWALIKGRLALEWYKPHDAKRKGTYIKPDKEKHDPTTNHR